MCPLHPKPNTSRPDQVTVSAVEAVSVTAFTTELKQMFSKCIFHGLLLRHTTSGADSLWQDNLKQNMLLLLDIVSVRFNPAMSCGSTAHLKSPRNENRKKSKL
jgi:hypothetical protein